MLHSSRMTIKEVAEKYDITPDKLRWYDRTGPMSEYGHIWGGRPETADEVSGITEILMPEKGAFITESAFLIYGSVTASCYCCPLQIEVIRYKNSCKSLEQYSF